MSALAGLVAIGRDAALSSSCESMLRAQRIYGPDASDCWSGDGVQMGRNLHRLVPEDAFDRQPLEGRFSERIVADVRIDNRTELAELLEISPEGLADQSDADLFLAAWEAWGTGLAARVAGVYAAAVWNERDRSLTLLRDPFGQRPLYFAKSDGVFAFASMPKGLHALAEFPLEPDREALARTLALVRLEPTQTHFRGLMRVPQAHAIKFVNGGWTVQRIWIPPRGSLVLESSEAYADQYRRHLDVAVGSHLRRARGGVAAHLSSGWDSAAVAATAARLLNKESARLDAYTAVPAADYDLPAPARRENNEGRLAAEVAKLHPNIDHHQVSSGAQSPMRSLDAGFYYGETPTTNPCNAVWDAAINAEAARRGATVLLTGERGNTTISYDGLDWLPELVGRGRLLTWFREARKVKRATAIRWRGLVARSFGELLPVRVWDWINRTYYGEDASSADYTAVRRSVVPEETLVARALSVEDQLGGGRSTETFDVRLNELHSWDGGAFNKAVLAQYGIDVRDPTADRRVVEFCLSVPNSEVLKDGHPRSLARRALADRLPAALLDNQRRGYQAADWHVGATLHQAELREELERIEANPMAHELIDTERLRRLLDNWPTGGWHTTKVRTEYRLALLRGLAVGHFIRKATGGNG